MEYIKHYLIKQNICTRTYAQLLKATTQIRRGYPEISIKIKNKPENTVIDLTNMDIISLLHHKIGNYDQSEIELIVSGLTSENILKKCANNIINILEEDYKQAKTNYREPSYSFS
ncbi:MAG TPA: hypothetical protein VJJ23_04145 [Candidatus Nanoarchaeia archaeon]|nr:hypothetical protein [Candidatus Nanoarchaeia archaeon]